MISTPASPRLISARSKRRLFLALASLPLAFTFSSSAFAQSTLSWSSTGSSTLGGAGLWDSSATNWWDGSSAVAWPASGTANTAVFGGTAGTVTVNAALSANALSFTSTGYILDGAQVLTLNGTAPTVSVASGLTATLGNNTALQLAGSSGLTKSGAGTLTVNSSIGQSLTGGITVNSGTLLFSLANLATPTDFVPSSNTLTVGAGTFTVTGKSGAVSSQTFANTVLTKGNAQIRVGNHAGSAAGSVTSLNLGVISRPTPGSVVLLNTATGGYGTVVSTTEKMYVSTSGAGWLAPWAFSGNNTTTSPRFAYADANGQILLVNGLGGGTNMASVTNPAAVYTVTGTQNVGAPVTAMGIQSNGNTTYNLGANSATIGAFMAIAANTASTFATTGGGTLQINSGKELFTTGIGTININVPIVDNPGNASHLTHVGAGTLSLGAVNTYTGETNLIGGTLVVSETGQINTSSGVFISAGTFRQMNFTDALIAPVTLQGGRVDGYGILTNLTVTNLAANTVANLATTTAPLEMANLTFQGAATIAPSLNSDPIALPLRVTGTVTTTASAGKVAVNLAAPGGAWTEGSTTYKILSYGTLAGSLSDFTLGTPSPAFSARGSATLNDEGGLITVTINENKAIWTGAANSNWTTSTVPDPANWILRGGGLSTQFINSDDAIFDDTAANTNVVISDASVSPNNIFVNNETLPYTISATGTFGIATGNIVKTGAALLTLGGTNTHTGLTSITAGTLALGSSTAFQGTGGLVLGSSVVSDPVKTAALDLNGHSARFTTFSAGTATTNSITNSGTEAGIDTLTILTPSTTAFAGLITDGPTAKTALAFGLGVIPGNVNNTYSGGYSIFGGQGGGIVTGSRISPTVAGNPVYVGDVFTSSPYGTGPITIGFNAADKSQIYFNVNGTTLGNDLIVNSALGSDTPGTLRVEGLDTTIKGSVTLNSDLFLYHNGTFSGGTGGGITFQGPLLEGSSPLAGLRVIEYNVAKDFVVTLANATPTANNFSGNIYLESNRVFLKLGAANQIPDGAGKGSLTLQNGSTLDLNGFSETINGLSGSGFVESITVNTPVTLTVGSGDATNQIFSGRIFDARGGAAISLTKVGTGIQVLSNDNLYTGTTTISAGTLQLGNGGTTGSLQTASSIVNEGTLAFSRSDAIAQGTHFSGSALTGTGGLTKLGTGSLTLNTANTYTGPTLVSAGTLIADGGASFGATKLTLATGSTFDLATLSAADLTLSGGLGGSGTVNSPAKTLIVGATFDPGALAVTGNLTLATGTATSLLATDSPATSSVVTVSGAVVNAGTLAINADTGFAFASGQSFTFFSATSITRGFTAVSVGSTNLTASSGGIWTGSASGLAYSYDENTGVLTVATGGTLSPLEQWRLTNLGTSENSGDAADSFDKDNDGIPNLLEYALTGNPNLADRSILPVATGGNPLSLTFTRLGDAGITYIVEASDTLATGSWTSIYTSTGTAGSVTVADPGPVVGNRRFLRLKVTTN